MEGLEVAAILGIVEGLTEFLPVSSTGHLIVAGNILGCTGEKAACFEVFIQLGAILAVVVLYWRRILGLLPFHRGEFLHKEGFSGFRGILLLVLTTLPALVIGFFAHHYIKAYLFGPITVAFALGIGGIGIILAERFKPEPTVDRLDNLTYVQALAVGLFQCISMWPGMSRAACTIIGGMLTRLDRKTATEYSFLAAVPVMIAATSYDLYRTWEKLDASDTAFFAVGFAVSFLAAAAAIKTLIAMVQRWSLVPFAWYRILIAPLVYFGIK